MRLIRNVDHPVGPVLVCSICRASVEVLEIKADDTNTTIDSFVCWYCQREENPENDRSLEPVRPHHTPPARARVPFAETPVARWEAQEPDLELDGAA